MSDKYGRHKENDLSDVSSKHNAGVRTVIVTDGSQNMDVATMLPTLMPKTPNHTGKNGPKKMLVSQMLLTVRMGMGRIQR